MLRLVVDRAREEQDAGLGEPRAVLGDVADSPHPGEADRAGRRPDPVERVGVPFEEAVQERQVAPDDREVAVQEHTAQLHDIYYRAQAEAAAGPAGVMAWLVSAGGLVTSAGGLVTVVGEVVRAVGEVVTAVGEVVTAVGEVVAAAGGLVTAAAVWRRS